MKSKSFKTLTILFSLLLVANVEMKAQTSKDVINYFYMKGEVCPPVTLSTSDGTIVVNNGDRIDGNIRIYSATDCRGNKILDISSDTYKSRTGQPSVAEYIFSTLYPTSDKNNSDDVPAYEDTYTPPVSNNGVEGTVINGVGKIAEGMREMTKNSVPIAGYPYLGLDLGLSRMYGEFARLHCCLGGDSGFRIYGGVGKDWVFDGDNKDKMSWHAGLGYYMALGDDDNQEFDFGITASETAAMQGGAITCDFGYRYFFGRTKRFGVLGSAGFGCGNFFDTMKSDTDVDKEEGKFIWDVSVGICVKMFASKNKKHYR